MRDLTEVRARVQLLFDPEATDGGHGVCDTHCVCVCVDRERERERERREEMVG